MQLFGNLSKHSDISEEVQGLFAKAGQFDTEKLDNFGKSFLQLADDAKITDANFTKFIITNQEAIKGYSNAEEALAGYDAYQKTSAKSAQLAEVKTKAFSAAVKIVSSIGWMALITGISWAIGKIGTAIDDNIIHKVKNATEAIENTMSAYESSKSDLPSTYKSYLPLDVPVNCASPTIKYVPAERSFKKIIFISVAIASAADCTALAQIYSSSESTKQSFKSASSSFIF